MARKGLLILGMHRSGTSALTGLLTKLGVAGPSRPMPANEYNEKGYYESREICRLMEELLHMAESRWHDWRSLDLQALPAVRLAEMKDKLVTATREEFGEAAIFAVKDPRIARAVPLWVEIMKAVDAEPHAIITMRHPHEVCQSLARRDGLPHDKAALLWVRHVLDAERYTRAMPRVFVAFDDLQSDPAAALTRIGANLGIVWPISPDSPAHPLDGFVEPQLVHHKPDELSPARTGRTARWYKPLWDLVGKAMASDPQVVDLDGFQRLHQAFDHATAPFAGYSNRIERALEEKNRRIAELEQSLQRTQWALGALLASGMRPEGKVLGDVIENAVRSQSQRFADFEQRVATVMRRLDALELKGEESATRASHAPSAEPGEAGVASGELGVVSRPCPATATGAKPEALDAAQDDAAQDERRNQPAVARPRGG